MLQPCIGNVTTRYDMMKIPVLLVGRMDFQHLAGPRNMSVDLNYVYCIPA